MSTFMPRKQWITLGVIILLLCLLVGLRPALAASTILVDNLAPSWEAPGGGGVFSAYIGPPDTAMFRRAAPPCTMDVRRALSRPA